MSVTQEEFLKIWGREAGLQFGLMLDVTSLEGMAINDNQSN